MEPLLQSLRSEGNSGRVLRKHIENSSNVVCSHASCLSLSPNNVYATNYVNVCSGVNKRFDFTMLLHALAAERNVRNLCVCATCEGCCLPTVYDMSAVGRLSSHQNSADISAYWHDCKIVRYMTLCDCRSGETVYGSGSAARSITNSSIWRLSTNLSLRDGRRFDSVIIRSIVVIIDAILSYRPHKVQS